MIYSVISDVCIGLMVHMLDGQPEGGGSNLAMRDIQDFCFIGVLWLIQLYNEYFNSTFNEVKKI